MPRRLVPPGLSCVLGLLAGLLASAPTGAPLFAATALVPGDIYVVDNGSQTVVRIDPRTGARSPVSSGSPMVNPVGIAVGFPDDLFVVDQLCCGGQGGVIRVDPTTGAQTVVASGGNFVEPSGIAVGLAGEILVADRDCCTNGNGAIIRVDRASGAQTILSSGQQFVDPTAIVVEPTGQLLVVDDGLPGVLRVDRVSGIQTVVSPSPSASEPVSIARSERGELFMVDIGTNSLLRVYPTSGLQTIVSAGGVFTGPNAVAVGPVGDLLVVDIACCGGPPAGGVIRVDPVTGAQAILSPGRGFGIAVVPVPRALLTGTGPGGAPHVRAFDAATAAELFGFFAYDTGFTGGVRVAAGDVDGDGVPDVVVAAGPGGGPHVRVLDGRSLFAGTPVEIHSFFAFPVQFTGGVFVGASDLTGSGTTEVVAAAGAGGGPHVRAFDGVTGSQITSPTGSFFPYPAGFTGGVFVTGYR